MNRLRSALKMILCVSILISAIPPNASAQMPDGEFFDYITLTRGSVFMHFMVFKNGDVYFRECVWSDNYWNPSSPVLFLGNFWGINPIHIDMIGYQIDVDPVQSWLSHWVLLSNGDVWMIRNFPDQSPMHFGGEPFFMGNFWNGTVSTDKSAWGGIKELFK